MTYKEQYKWLTDNGFTEVQSAQQNGIFWKKNLQDDRSLHFSWYNGGGMKNPSWSVDIRQENDEVWLIDLNNDQNFNRVQPLIDLLK